ncbi:helix-turn-helix domain-containing protein [Clostridium beijerinckii]|uniref:Helix-turn-helix transcriptional regulator n=1 Tax=Clostridium beijerinckii TaxID=1520 RepID=A0AAE2UZ25_CLOBE|nr:helix-turn-helix transcriptional regulator [Clostridium beijerinckii]MBF7807203.1 helix-turn-helix transcriptional regulator [Clostridium beijerinckii]NRT25637.1 DNA-binding XRE family transcriptional regulator [Clostridium beijerinckii]NRT66768.1 DNA-binding XRE family transcriptional regulator [Clostridium beijerinckii]NRT81732.1 DNA-binding XRE family transcriptional regulator [Clostridium beijerinckii]NRU51576.1 DNA-binding XRE family transcriptional regulator [Clostridium beijerinckii]
MRIDLKDEFKDLPANTIAENLIRLRKLNNLTQKELSLTIGISKSSISKYERGELFPTKEQSIKLASYFNINSKYFYDPYLESMDNFHQYLSTVLNKNIHINKDKLCKSLDISKRTLYRYCYQNNVPSRNIFDRMESYLNT